METRHTGQLAVNGNARRESTGEREGRECGIRSTDPQWRADSRRRTAHRPWPFAVSDERPRSGSRRSNAYRRAGSRAARRRSCRPTYAPMTPSPPS
eukprot:4091070-Prymnesium_polylepis.1